MSFFASWYQKFNEVVINFWYWKSPNFWEMWSRKCFEDPGHDWVIFITYMVTLFYLIRSQISNALWWSYQVLSFYELSVVQYLSTCVSIQTPENLSFDITYVHTTCLCLIGRNARMLRKNFPEYIISSLILVQFSECSYVTRMLPTFTLQYLSTQLWYIFCKKCKKIFF